MVSSKCLILLIAIKYTLSHKLQELQNDIIAQYKYETYKGECVYKIVNKYFPHGSHFQQLRTTEELVYVLNHANRGTCCKNTYSLNTKDLIWTTTGYMISVKNKTEFIKIMKLLKRNRGWNPRAKYIIEVTEIETNEEVDLFETLLDLNIFNVVLLKRHNNEIEILTYFCYDNNNCCKSVNNVTSFGKCSDLDKVDLFPNKGKDAFRNCSFTVAVSEDPPFVIDKNNKDFQFLNIVEGVEQYMLSNIGKQENISIQYLVVPPNVRYGMVLPNGSLSGSLFYMENKTASIVAGAFLLIKNRAEVLDFMLGYSFPSLKVYASATSEQSWKNICKPFGKIMWILLVVTYLFVTFVITIVRQLIIGNEDRQWIMLRTWGYFYGNTDSNLFRPSKLKSFMIVWILFTFFISSFYNTALYSLLTRKHTTISPAYDKRFTSFMKPCITDTMFTLFKYTYNETLDTDKSPECLYIETALDKVGEETNVYTIYLEYSYQFREYKYIDKDGNRKLDTWDYASNFIVSMYTTKGFPLLKKFQRYINYFFETGLTHKHLNDIYFRSQLLKNKRTNRFKPVPLSDFRLHFYILLFGTLISIICFVVELKS